MLIDKFMPAWDFDEKHETIVRASAEQVYEALSSFDFNESAVIRWLFRLRGLAANCSGGETSQILTLRDAPRLGFVFLGEKPNEEILFGLVGKFWKPAGDLQKVGAEDFQTFNKGGYAKAVWNFTVAESAEGETHLTTETRVRCTDEASHESFRFYWYFIKPFSGWIREEALRLAREKAEAAS